MNLKKAFSFLKIFRNTNEEKAPVKSRGKRYQEWGKRCNTRFLPQPVVVPCFMFKRISK